MTLADFMERLDEQQGENPMADEDRFDDSWISANADRQLPTFGMWAERAGVTLDELTGEIRERVVGVAGVIRKRIGYTHARADHVQGELEMLACACALQFFCAGALWEQERNMPDLNLDSTGER